MKTAYDKSGRSVDIMNAVSTDEYFCKVCKKPVVRSFSEASGHVFTHEGRACVLSQNQQKSEWFFSWRDRFPVYCRDVYVRTEGSGHLFDAVTGNICVNLVDEHTDASFFNSFFNVMSGKDFAPVWIVNREDKDPLELMDSHEFIGYDGESVGSSFFSSCFFERMGCSVYDKSVVIFDYGAYCVFMTDFVWWSAAKDGVSSPPVLLSKSSYIFDRSSVVSILTDFDRVKHRDANMEFSNFIEDNYGVYISDMRNTCQKVYRTNHKDGWRADVINAVFRMIGGHVFFRRRWDASGWERFGLMRSRYAVEYLVPSYLQKNGEFQPWLSAAKVFPVKPDTHDDLLCKTIKLKDICYEMISKAFLS